MRQISKFLVILIACITLVMPLGTAMAITNSKPTIEPKADTQIKANAKACSELSNLQTKVNSDLGNRLSKHSNDHGQGTQKMVQARKDADIKRATARANADTTRTDNFTKLEAKATTDAQKTAVKTFEETVTAAVQVRRSTVDSAVTTYRAAIDAAISAQQTAADQAITTLKSEYTQAFATAQTNCIDQGFAAVRAQLKTNLKNASDKFKASKPVMGDLEKTRQSLAATRDQSIKDAKIQFDSVFSAAVKNLKTALGDTSI